MNEFKNFLKKLLLYISAFVPMYVLVLLRLVVEIVNQNLTFNFLNTLNFVTALVLIFAGVGGLVWSVKFSKEKAVEIQIISKRNITDQHFLGYFSLFVFFAIPLDLSLVSAYCVYVVVLIMIGIVYINNSLFYINPLLNLLGYNFYDIKYKELNGTEVKTAKMFFRGEFIIEDKTYWARVKNKHFTFVDSKHKDAQRESDFKGIKK